MRAYATADPQTRENIVLGQFKQGIDQEARLWVDMREPQTVEEARAVYERYQSNLNNKLSSGRGLVRAVHTDPVEDDMVSLLQQRISQIEDSLTIAAVQPRTNMGSGQTYNHQRPPLDMSERRCYGCDELGHMIATCPSRRQNPYLRGQQPQYGTNR